MTGEPIQQQPSDHGDVANANRFASMWEGRLMYVPQRGAWFEFDEQKQKWVRDELRSVTQRAIQATRKMMLDSAQLIIQAASDITESGRRDKLARGESLAKEAKQAQAKIKLDSMVSIASTDPLLAIDAKEIDSDEMLAGVDGGVVDLRTGLRRQGEPSDRITRSMGTAYDASATCATWLKFLSEVQPDADVRLWLQKFVGYCLTGRTDEQIFVCLHGAGSNGKSVFSETLKRLVGEYSATTGFDTFASHSSESIRNDLARLDKIRLVVASESNDTMRLDEALIKNVTGGEKITARFLHREFFEFQPQFKIVLVTNHLPKISGTDNGIWRRVVAVPWLIKIEDGQKDRRLGEKLQKELPGILNWAIDGLRMYQQDGLKLPPDLEKARNCYKTDSDDVAEWASDCLLNNSSSIAASAGLAESYREWAKKVGRLVLSDRALGDRLKEMVGVKKCRLSNGRSGWSGIEIRLN
jgi:putative DNA primase/helicase